LEKIDNYTAENYLSRVIKRLEAERFNIASNIEYKDQFYKYFAQRTKFEFDKFSLIFTFFLFSRFPSLDSNALKDFSAKSFKYAVKPILPRGFVFGIFCYPVAIVDNIDDTTSEFIRRKAPPKHWAAFEMPVVYSLSSGELHYCEVTPTLGMIYYDEMRATINSMLAP
jgi:hypothetical protein